MAIEHVYVVVDPTGADSVQDILDDYATDDYTIASHTIAEDGNHHFVFTKTT
jgi:hypothetical protein